MADDKTKRGSPDNKRLNKSEPYEVAYAKSMRRAAAKKAAGSNGAAKRATPAKKTAAKSGSARTSPASGSRARKTTEAKRAPAAQRAASPGRAAAKKAGAARTRATPKPPKEEKTVENTAPRTMKEADAVDLLTDDHLEVGALFKQYEKLAKKSAPAGQRQPLAQKICDMLTAHTTIEEEIFYPAARQAGVDADLVDEADIEHASAKDLIAQIESGNPDDDHYDAKVKVLGEYVVHHVVEEHTEMFTKCRRSGMDLVALRAQLEERKMALMPEAEDGPAAAKKAGASGLLSKINDTLFG